MLISFLTQPLASWERFAKDCERRINYVKYRLQGNAYKAWTCTYPLGGHQDLVESFIKGAQQRKDVELLVNPPKRGLGGSVAYIPGSWRALRDSIPLRRAGIIKKLIAGPLICYEHVDEHGGIIGSDAIDCYIVASEWVEREYSRESAARGFTIKNMRVCPAGVDHVLWSPRELKEDKSHPRRAMVYVKGEGYRVLGETLDELTRGGFECRVLKYGTHVPADYKNLLEWCDFAVVLGGSETQGLALTQAWSMNRPTFVYESEDVLARGRDAAPYITPMTGSKWRRASDIPGCIEAVPACSPRRWVVENQTNEIVFEKFLDIASKL